MVFIKKTEESSLQRKIMDAIFQENQKEIRNNAKLRDLDSQLKRVIAYEQEAKQEEQQRIKHLELREQQKIKEEERRSKEAARRSKEEEFRTKRNDQHDYKLQVIALENQMFLCYPKRLELRLQNIGSPSEETKSQLDQIEQTIIGFQNQIIEKKDQIKSMEAEILKLEKELGYFNENENGVRHFF